MIEELLDREDRRRYSLSQQELKRRWEAVRERMAAKEIDYLVFQSQQRYVGGYFRWFTDIPGVNFHITGIFPLDDDMTIIGARGTCAGSSHHPTEMGLEGCKTGDQHTGLSKCLVGGFLGCRKGRGIDDAQEAENGRSRGAWEYVRFPLPKTSKAGCRV